MQEVGAATERWCRREARPSWLFRSRQTHNRAAAALLAFAFALVVAPNAFALTAETVPEQGDNREFTPPAPLGLGIPSSLRGRSIGEYLDERQSAKPAAVPRRLNREWLSDEAAVATLVEQELVDPEELDRAAEALGSLPRLHERSRRHS